MIQIHRQIPFLFGSVESGYKYFLISIHSAFDALTIDFYFFQMNHYPFSNHFRWSLSFTILILSAGMFLASPNACL